MNRTALCAAGVLRRRASLSLLSAALVAAMLVTMLACSRALATEPVSPPTFEGTSFPDFWGPTEPVVRSTSMQAVMRVKTYGLPAKWRTEYATSSNALEKGEGTLSTSGEYETEKDAEVGFIEFGAPSGSARRGVLRGLTPSTHYYARFAAENAASAGHPTYFPFEFTTLPVSKPEIYRTYFFYGPSVEGAMQEISISPTKATFQISEIDANGAATTYALGYSTSPSGPFTTCASGSISVAQEFAEPKLECTGLTPETTYYLRLEATNEKGSVEEHEFFVRLRGDFDTTSFTTPPAKPIVNVPTLRNVTADTAHASDQVITHHSETHWQFEIAPSALGPWSAAAGAAGTISQAEAEAEAGEGEGAVQVGGALSGLSPASTFYVRLFAENAAGEADVEYVGSVNGHPEPLYEPLAVGMRGLASFQTAGPPSAETLAVHTLHGEAIRVIGAVNPNSKPTSAEQLITVTGPPTGGTFRLSFAGHTTQPLAWDASAASVTAALVALPGNPEVTVQGSLGGPYTVWFYGRNVEGAQPPIEGHGEALTPSGSVSVAVTQAGGQAYDAHYRFQYISQRAFEAQNGFAGPDVKETSEVDAGSGVVSRFASLDLGELTPGETYRYRIVATSDSPGDPVVYGSERQLTIPAPSAAGAVACPNESLRTGASARLPDCRGYEQVTPRFKGGTLEPFDYGGAALGGVAIGEGGEQVALVNEELHWGAGSGAGDSPYVFTRDGGGGWQFRAAGIQPETGIDKIDAATQLFAGGLGGFAFASSYETSPGSESKNVEYKAGPPGGPYQAIASIPIKQAEKSSGWVASDEGFSKLILQIEDRGLLERRSTTKSGDDLYELVNGELRQANVTSQGATIGSCGATIVHGDEEQGSQSSTHAVSDDGSRVFFEAVPGTNCNEVKHLYVRVNGESTIDLGGYRFRGANAEGTQVLLEKQNGQVRELLLDDLRTSSQTTLFSAASITQMLISRDLSVVYFVSREGLTPDTPSGLGDSEEYLYGYDLATHTLSFIDTGEHIGLSETSSDGSYLYFRSEGMEGVPGESPQAVRRGTGAGQVYRYDSGESLVQCMSCASPYDPEPRLLALFSEYDNGPYISPDGHPLQRFASANGDYVFFDTPAALVPSDVDGEVAPETGVNLSVIEHSSQSFSVSSDVYEWRKPGVDGCVHLQGCLALITNGRGGFLNLLLGTDESGRDVFVYTSSPLGPEDKDNAGDIYDARIGGGTAVVARPTECEGDACSAPPAAPNDATPSSLTFSGAGNIAQLPQPVAKYGKPELKKKRKVGKKKRGKQHKGRKAKKSGHDRGRR